MTRHYTRGRRGSGLVQREERRCWVLGLSEGSWDREGGSPRPASPIPFPRTEPQRPAPAPLTPHHLLTLPLILLFALRLSAQVAPDLHWQSLHTPHFHTHFSPGLEPIARRAAGSAERAYSRLAKELHEPRGPIDLVVADNVDVSNGFTTTFPSNRITIYARPTVDANSLKFLDDWIDLVVTHELAHVFHLDRTRGWWRLGQYVFGRNPFLFPNQYTPSWLVEGIAVYYETRLTGAGRDAGTEFDMIVRANAVDGRTPALNALSSATPVFPLGSTPYAYGSELVLALANTAGAAKMRDFVETSSARTIPFLLNANAKSAFGVSFDSAYRRFRDSLARDALALSRPGPSALRDVTARGWFTQRVRWIDDAHLIYGNNDGRDVSALRELGIATGASRWLARRNSLDVTSPARSGARVFAQQEFTDRYTIRSDLWLEQAGRTTQLTSGERLMQPDARLRPPDSGLRTPASGLHTAVYDIIAVQLTPGASRLVRLRFSDGAARLTPDVPDRLTPAGDAARLTPLTGSSPDTVWSEPRWSHDGRRIAATRWTHGGASEIAILDTSGLVLATVGRARAVNGSPSWMRGDSAIFFTSDRTGRSALYRAWLPAGRLERIAESATGLLESEQSPDGSRLATLHYRGDGWHVSLLSTSTLDPRPSDSSSVLPPSRNDPIAVSSAPLTPYSAWPSLLPKYWLPAIEPSDKNRAMYGFITSGSDVLDRHVYQLRATYEPGHHEPNADFSYQYNGLGTPALGLAGSEVWDHLLVADSTRKRGVPIARRKYFGIASLTFARPRVRTYSSFTVGAEMEWRDFRAYPDTLFGLLTRGDRAVLRDRYTYPSFFVSAGFSNVRQPALAISYEDGIQLSTTATQRWRSDVASETRSTSVVGAASAYKSLDLPGFAHHVIALRAAAGWEDDKATSEFKVGGVSGSILTIAPGVTIGDGRRTFPVRGFPASSQIGTQALGGSVEYRAPISLPASGYRMLPLFFQRVSAVLFADGATAWCPAGLPATLVCPAKGYPRDWMASAGAELHLDAAYQYDAPYRFRLGAATPVTGRSYFGTNEVAVYFAVGLAF